MAAASARTTNGARPPRDPLADQLVLAGRGDPGAFADVYDRTAPRVFGLALRVTGDSDQAEEVAQGVFADIWSQSARFDRTQGSAIAWMMSLAHRRAVERVRSARASGQDSVVDKSQTSPLPQALVSLSEPERRYIELAYLDGYTHTDISGLVQEQPGVALNRLSDALRNLAEQN